MGGRLRVSSAFLLRVLLSISPPPPLPLLPPPPSPLKLCATSSPLAGPRGAREIAAAVTALLHERHLAPLRTQADLDALGAAAAASDAQSQPRLARAVLFTDKPKATVLAKALSTAYAGRLLFGQAVKGEADALAAALGVEEWPTLLVVKADGSKEAYKGALKAPLLRAFLDGFAAPEPAALGGAGDGTGTSEGAAGAGARGAGAQDPMAALLAVPVEALTPANLTALDADDAMWLLAVHGGAAKGEGDGGAPACADGLKKFEALAKGAQSVVRYGALAAGPAAVAAADADADADAAGALRDMGVDLAALKERPCALQLVLLPHGAGKRDLDEYKAYAGPLDDAKALQAWLLEETPDATAMIASEAELRAFMAAAPGAMNEGRALLFASKAEVPGVYKALALNVRRAGARFQFGWVSSAAPAAFREQALAMFKAPRAPALVAAVPVRTDAANAPPGAEPGSVQMGVQPYVGPLKYQLMSLWLRTLAASTGISDDAAILAPGGGRGGGAPGGGAGGGAGRAPLVSSHEELESACYNAAALCVLGLVDARAKRFDEHAAAMATAAAQQAAKRPGIASFALVDLPRQPAVAAALGLDAGGSGLPALAVLSPRRLRFALAPPHLASDFGAAAVDELLGGVLAGKLPTAPLEALPRLLTEEEAAAAGAGGGSAGGGDSSDGDAAEPPAEEADEFDLSEIMSEDVAIESHEARLKRAEAEAEAEAEAAAAAARAKAEAEEAAKAAKKRKGGGKKKKKGKKKAKSQDGGGGGAKDEL